MIIRRNGQEQILKARREVILSTGAVASPAILERSGIGWGDRLAGLGIDVTHDLPGVGENLQDHLQLRLIYKISGTPTLNSQYKSLLRRAGMGLQYALFRRGPMTMAPSQLGAFTRSSADFATPNLEFHIQPLSLDKFGDPLHPFDAFTVGVAHLRPSSRGSIHARSNDPDDAPIIAPNYLSSEDDRRVAVDVIRLARRIVSTPVMEQYAPVEYLPGAELTSDEDLTNAARDVATTIFHPVGTAKMGVDNDPMAVIDGNLRVRGMDRLRVVDASVMPNITSGNTNSPIMKIAEKATGRILAGF